MGFTCPHNGGDMPCMVCDNEMLVAENKRLRERLDKIIDAAIPVVLSLEDVGNCTDWRDGDETDRVYAWWEIKPLKEALREATAHPTPDAAPGRDHGPGEEE